MLLAAIGTALRVATGEEHAGAVAATRLARLSTRERQVLDRLALGRPHKVISADLGISARTVEVHRRRMLDRLGVGTAAEAIRLWALGSPPS
jgi:two-component system, LuxR family, response regulator FixJ